MCLMSLPLGAEDLIRLESPGIEVVSDAGETSARALIDRALEMRLAFPHEFFSELKIFVLERGQRFNRIRPNARANAFFLRGAGENFIALPDAKQWRSLRHELVHFALDHSALALPMWLEEGLAEYYSTLDVRPDQLVVGEPIPEHLSWLRKNGVTELSKLLALSRDGGPELYATGWALVHMLKLAPGYGPRFGRFWQRLQQGERAEAILPDVFGRSLPAIAADLTAYAMAPVLPTEAIAITERMQAPSHVAVQRLTQDQFDERYLALVRAAGRLDEVQRMTGASPVSADVARALRATAENRPEDAREAWRAAIDAGAQRADVYFEYAGALRDARAPEGDIAAALRRAVELNPRFTQAHVLLASLEGKAERWAEAERHLALASQESPRRFEIWYELAFVRRALGNIAAAGEAAVKALAVAATALDREKASALRDSLTATPVERKAPVIMAKGWEMPAGDKQAEGVWLELVCEQPAAVVKLDTAAGMQEWIIRDPGKVTLRHTGSLSYEFQCGKQEPARRVRLGYESSTREVRVLEFLASEAAR